MKYELQLFYFCIRFDTSRLNNTVFILCCRIKFFDCFSIMKNPLSKLQKIMDFLVSRVTMMEPFYRGSNKEYTSWNYAIQWQIQDFIEGTPTRKVGTPIHYFAHFPLKKRVKIKIGPRGLVPPMIHWLLKCLMKVSRIVELSAFGLPLQALDSDIPLGNIISLIPTSQFTHHIQ